MKVFDYIEKLNLFHHYVIKENTGNAACFAEKLGVSRATVYNMIDDLRAFNVDIRYSRSRETYYYKQPETVEIKLFIRQLNSEELIDTSGGRDINSTQLIKILFVYGFR